MNCERGVEIVAHHPLYRGQRLVDGRDRVGDILLNCSVLTWHSLHACRERLEDIADLFVIAEVRAYQRVDVSRRRLDARFKGRQPFNVRL